MTRWQWVNFFGCLIMACLPRQKWPWLAQRRPWSERCARGIRSPTPNLHSETDHDEVKKFVVYRPATLLGSPSPSSDDGSCHVLSTWHDYGHTRGTIMVEHRG